MSKYGAKKVVVDGIKFDSKTEADYYVHLLHLKKTGLVKNFELQPVYELLPAFILNGKKKQPIKYKADFVVTYADNSVEIIDIKGFETTDFKIKKKLFEHKFQRELKCIAYSKIDGGWIDLDSLKANRTIRKKAKNQKRKELEALEERKSKKEEIKALF